MDHDDIEGLAAALHAGDLTRIQTFPPALLLRRDACVPSRGQRLIAAPMVCAIDYALYAVVDHIHGRLPPWPVAQGAPQSDASSSCLYVQRADQTADQAAAAAQRAAPEALATEMVAETPEFAVVDWLLDRFPQLLDAPLDSTYAAAHTAVPVRTQTPLLRTLDSLMRPNPYEALALFARLLQRGAALGIDLGSQGDVASYIRIGIGGRRSPLCYALDVAVYPAGTHAVRMLLAAGAGLAPGEAPMAVQRCLMSPFSQNHHYMHAPAVQLRTLLPVYGRALRGQTPGSRGGGMFETLKEQESVATTWLATPTPRLRCSMHCACSA